jgi:hypothetical protein
VRELQLLFDVVEFAVNLPQFGVRQNSGDATDEKMAVYRDVKSAFC